MRTLTENSALYLAQRERRKIDMRRSNRRRAWDSARLTFLFFVILSIIVAAALVLSAQTVELPAPSPTPSPTPPPIYA